MTATLHPQFRFETLVVGAANRLAATAARAVAEAPGSVYNPLFVYARPGLGKTHLLMAIAHAAVAIDPRLVVRRQNVDHEATGEPADQALVQPFDLRRRAIAGQDDLPAGALHRIDQPDELGLHLAPLAEELDVVEEEQADLREAPSHWMRPARQPNTIDLASTNITINRAEA